MLGTRLGVLLGLALPFAFGAACGRSSKSAFSPDPDAGPQAFDRDDAAIHACPGGHESSSIGCEYYAVMMDGTFDAEMGCYAVFIANASLDAAHLSITFAGTPVDLAQYAKIPTGSGRALTYADFSPVSGVQPGEVVIVFLAGPPDAGVATQDQDKPTPCPVAPAFSAYTQVRGTGRGHAFRIRTDAPVAAYQMLPYGGGGAAVTGATALIPTSAYDTNYILTAAFTGDGLAHGGPSTDIVAAEDDTSVTILPNADLVGGAGVDEGPAGQPVTYTLNAGEFLQFTQYPDATGSPVQSDKPIGMFAGHTCTGVGPQCCCDHIEAQIPAVRSMGSEFAIAGYRPRTQFPEKLLYRFIGAVDGTTLTYSPAVGGPPSIGKGQVLAFNTDTPFTVKSQSSEHPFMVLTYMSSANDLGTSNDRQGYGDPEVVRAVPVAQHRSDYTFFTDPTYPETNLVVTRKRGANGFADVKLDCAGTLGGWQPIDPSDTYEFTRVDLVRHDFQRQGSCDNGRHRMTSSDPFGLTVWGWGSPETKDLTTYVSYGYPAGENLSPINDVVVPAR
jgi:hypothetical protein